MIVSSIQNDTSDSYKFSCQLENEFLSKNTTNTQPVSEDFEVADTLTVVQFIHHQSVAAVIILLASLSQGGFSQVLFDIKQDIWMKPLIIAIKSCSDCSGHKNKKCFTSEYNKKELINTKTCFNYKICIYDKALQLSIGSRSNKESYKNTLTHFAIAIAISRSIGVILSLIDCRSLTDVFIY